MVCLRITWLKDRRLRRERHATARGSSVWCRRLALAGEMMVTKIHVRGTALRIHIPRIVAICKLRTV